MTRSDAVADVDDDAYEVTIDGAFLRRHLANRWVLGVYALLVVPLAVGQFWRMTPLALPGYVIMTAGTVIGRALVPNYEMWLYWVPFLLSCYGLAVLAGAALRALVGRVSE